MFRIALALFTIGMVAAMFGFGAFPNYTWEWAKILCYISTGLAVVVFVIARRRE